jgi:hypothetical protein
VNSISWTIDTINDAFELAGSALLGAGMLALVWVGMRARSRGPAWSRYTLAVGLVLLATAGAYAAQSFDLVDVLLVARGAVLLPLWLLDRPAPARRRGTGLRVTARPLDLTACSFRRGRELGDRCPSASRPSWPRRRL